MTPNYDNLRTLLVHLRSLNRPSDFRNVEGISDEEANLYLELLADAGLIEGNLHPNKHGGFYYVSRITLKGNQFLDKITDDDLWENAKKSGSDSNAEKSGSGSKEISKIADVMSIISFIVNASGGAF